jgi:hypothetical protein
MVEMVQLSPDSMHSLGTRPQFEYILYKTIVPLQNTVYKDFPTAIKIALTIPYDMH